MAKDQRGDTDTRQATAGSRTRRYVTLAVAGVLVFVFLVLLATHTGFLPVSPGEYDQRTLGVTDCSGTEQGTLTVDVADSFSQRYVGLSRTDSLGADEGMLFAYGSEDTRDIGMRNMDFGLDVLYIGSNGTVRTVETLDAPSGPVEYYLTYDSTAGTGQYILEVPAGWSTEHGVSRGDCVTGLP